MLGRLFGGGGGPRLKPMKRDHLLDVIRIIEETDEDDAEEAEENLSRTGGEGMFVLVDGGRVIGVTGAVPAEDAPDIAWLSWTYLARSHQGKGLGRMMFDQLLGTLNEHGIRKVFIATSDYMEDGENIYAAAHRLYEEMGAAEELRVPGFHGPGEAMIVYGLDNPAFEAPEAWDEEPPRGLIVEEAQRAPDSDKVAALHWREPEEEEVGPAVRGLSETMRGIRDSNARMAVISLPAPFSDLAAGDLGNEGFAETGRLRDFYAAGVDQVWWKASA